MLLGHTPLPKEMPRCPPPSGPSLQTEGPSLQSPLATRRVEPWGQSLSSGCRGLGWSPLENSADPEATPLPLPASGRGMACAGVSAVFPYFGDRTVPGPPHFLSSNPNQPLLQGQACPFCPPALTSDKAPPPATSVKGWLSAQIPTNTAPPWPERPSRPHRPGASGKPHKGICTHHLSQRFPFEKYICFSEDTAVCVNV